VEREDINFGIETIEEIVTREAVEALEAVVIALRGVSKLREEATQLKGKVDSYLDFLKKEGRQQP
jgi:hypothetical protein